MGIKLSIDKFGLLFLGLIIAFAAVKLSHNTYTIGDENVYFYMGKLVGGGLLPYSDFFFAHPPFQLLVFGFLSKLFGFAYPLLKLSDAFWAIAISFLLFLTVKKKVGGVEALAAAAVFLFSYDTLRFTNHPNGAAMAALLSFLGFYLVVEKKPFWSGLILGLAGLTRYYALPVALGLMVYLFFTDKKDLKRLIAGFSLTFILGIGLMIALFKGDFLTQTIAYHLFKPEGQLSKLDVAWRVISANLLLFGSALLFILNRKKITATALAALAVLVVYLVFFIIIGKIFGYYFLIIFPFLVLLAAYGIYSLGQKFGSRIFYAALLSVIALASAWSIYAYSSYDLQDFVNAKEISEYIKANSNPDDTVFGDDATTPLLALLSDRRIALDFADSNNQRFRSGVSDINETISRLKTEGVKFVVVQRLDIGIGNLTYGPAFMDEFEGYIANDCEPAEEFPQQWRSFTRRISIYDCEQS